MKRIHWNIPFTSVKGESYNLWIYDEGYSGPQVMLQAGQVPFTTEENTDTDFFSPVRGSTGSISIIDPDGTIMNSLLPANNTSRPVRLVKSVNGGQQFVWQGFLTCNTYSQGYTNRPQEVSLQVASLLDAADSISAKQSNFYGLMTVRQIIHVCVAAIKDEFGRPTAEELVSTFYFPKADWRILNYWINTSIFFEEKEVVNENIVSYIIVGKSIKYILETVCKFMGWCVRECPNRVLSFQRMNDKNSTYLYVSYADFANGDKSLGSVWHEEIKSSLSLANLSYIGTGHEISTSQGAKSVEVVAKVEKFSLNISLPACPAGSLIEQYRQLWKNGTTYGDWLYILANSNATAYSNISVAYYSGFGGLGGNAWVYEDFHYARSSLAAILEHNAVGPNSSVVYMWHLLHNSATWYAGACLCKYDWEGTGTATAHNTSDALYCAFLPLSLAASYGTIVMNPDFNPLQVGAIFSISSMLFFKAINGYIKLTANAETTYWYSTSDVNPINVTHSNDIDDEWGIALELSIGENWWNGSSWQTYKCYFFARMTKNGFKKNWNQTMPVNETDGLLIPINNMIQGAVTLKIWPMASNLASDSGTTFAKSAILEMIFSSLEVGYIPPQNAAQSERGENRYFSLLGTNFNEGKSVQTDLASYMNNIPSLNIIMYTQTDPMQYMIYSYPSGDATERPEKDLLARLARYYKKRRSTIQLEVEHINDSLPTTRVIADGIPCEPIAESRDYQLDKTTVTLMEESASSE